MDASVFNGNLSWKKKIINLTQQRFGLTRVLFSCILLVSWTVKACINFKPCIKIVPTMERGEEVQNDRCNLSLPPADKKLSQ